MGAEPDDAQPGPLRRRSQPLKKLVHEAPVQRQDINISLCLLTGKGEFG
jgi:hypothetical protein